MEKLSSEQVKEVLSQAADTIRKLAESRDAWKKEAQVRMRRDEAEKVASAMHAKGLQADVPFEDLVAQMEKAAENGNLTKIAEAVELVGPDMGQKFAHLSTDESRATVGSSFEQFLMGGVG